MVHFPSVEQKPNKLQPVGFEQSNKFTDRFINRSYWKESVTRMFLSLSRLAHCRSKVVEIEFFSFGFSSVCKSKDNRPKNDHEWNGFTFHSKRSNTDLVLYRWMVFFFLLLLFKTRLTTKTDCRSSFVCCELFLKQWNVRITNANRRSGKK